jgi:hypothetical protein
VIPLKYKKVSRSLTHSFAPRSNFGVKVVMAGVLYENKVVSSSAINGNVKAGGSDGGDVFVRMAIFVIGEWVRSVTAFALSGDAIFLGDDCVCVVFASDSDESNVFDYLV